MPYGYYTLVRFVSMVGFAYLTLSCVSLSKKNLAWCFGSLALLFQPLVPFKLGRDTWQIVDIVVGVFLVIVLFNAKFPSKKDE